MQSISIKSAQEGDPSLNFMLRVCFYCNLSTHFLINWTSRCLSWPLANTVSSSCKKRKVSFIKYYNNVWLYIYIKCCWILKFLEPWANFTFIPINNYSTQQGYPQDLKKGKASFTVRAKPTHKGIRGACTSDTDESKAIRGLHAGPCQRGWSWPQVDHTVFGDEVRIFGIPNILDCTKHKLHKKIVTAVLALLPCVGL